MLWGPHCRAHQPAQCGDLPGSGWGVRRAAGWREVRKASARHAGSATFSTDNWSVGHAGQFDLRRGDLSSQELHWKQAARTALARI